MGHKRDIDTIRCYFDLSDDGNNMLFSREGVHKRLSKDIGEYLDKYGLQYEILPLGEKGGGGESILWEALKLAWENKSIIGLIFSLIKIGISIPKVTISMLNRMSSQTKPRIIVSLSLETDENFDDRNLTFYLCRKLINLKNISDNLLKELSSKYQIFRFDQSFELFMSARHFLIRYEVKAEHQNTFNSFRLVRLFKNLRIKDNSYSVYEFTKFLLVSRFDGSMQVEE